ncbi:hypothetical protein FEM48_Zijuj10G0109000 [Ziziphus jujuba var. spinosa]|uniref:NADP-dependent oxidoreductase domain-containing protein n=1 Tax=Ziziphus jujuba var. spinosa TaxID=714518 RepID=A0A978UMY7_ZIZJJ|nr:hypothetical protein FEM48_Zijuj10G0109000 [Ziziphus jujuba var. spinosa]
MLTPNEFQLKMPVAPLGSSGKTIPILGFGTAEYPFGNFEAVKQSVLYAIKLGHRHFDTAAIYQSEKPLGEAISEALRLGLIKSRRELFITSKLWSSDTHHDLVLPAIRKTLMNLGLEYLDLYLIHFPASLNPGVDEVPFDKEDIMAMDMVPVWKAMEECQNLGLTKSIGVSNFTCKRLEELLAIASIPPAVNQVEINPHWQQKKLREYCTEKGIHVTAFSPLGARGTPWGSNRVMQCQILNEIAETKGKTVAQVCLRWVYEQGVSLVVKSFKEERIAENLDILDWKLTAEELRKISQIRQKRGLLAEQYVSENGPYKSTMEIWDNEI